MLGVEYGEVFLYVRVQEPELMEAPTPSTCASEGFLEGRLFVTSREVARAGDRQTPGGFPGPGIEGALIIATYMESGSVPIQKRKLTFIISLYSLLKHLPLRP